MSARLTTSLWVSAHITRCQIAGAGAVISRRGADQSGAVILKMCWLSAPPSAPLATALSRATGEDGGLLWLWLVGPEPAPEAEVDAKLARQASFDPDIWIVEIEDRDGRHFLDDPIA